MRNNAKDELKTHLKGEEMVCCFIQSGEEDGYNTKEDVSNRTYFLKENYTSDEEKEFWQKLDFEYDSGYGGQELFGLVWLRGGAWLSRGEYDGSEWWELNKLPPVPVELKSLKRILKKI